jgi:prevent-host-death family protein
MIATVTTFPLRLIQEPKAVAPRRRGPVSATAKWHPPRIIDIYLPSELRIHALINQLIRDTMDHRIDAHTARTQFGQLMDLATRNNERFIVERRGEPAVVIMSVQDFIRTAAPPPDWLQKAWAGAERRGRAAMPPEEIEAEISAHRRSKKDSGASEAT